MNRKSFKHWAVVAVLCGMAAASLGLCVNCSGVFFTPIANDLGLKRGSVAMTATIATFMSAISSIVVPKVLNRKNLKLLIGIGTVMAAGSTLLMSLCSSLWQFYVLAFIRGFGIGFFAMVMITLIVNRWFRARNGLATSITMSFSGLCGALGSPVFTSLINAQGWRTAYVVMGVVNVLLCLPAILMPFTLDPADCGLAPYGADAPGQVKKQTQEEGTASVTAVMIGMMMVMAFLGSGLTSFTQHLPAVSEQFGYTASVGALTLSFALVGNIISKLVIGVLSDRFGARRAYQIVMAINLAAILLLLTVRISFVSLAAAFFFGWVYASAGVGMSLLTRSYVGNKRYADVYRIVNLAGSTGAALILSVIGYIYDFAGSYIPAILTVLAMNLIVMLLTFLIQVAASKK